MKVGLFGTCANSSWREKLLKNYFDQNIEFFDSRVKNWNEEAKQNEIIQRQICDLIIYAITPSLQGFFTFFESLEDVFIKKSESTVFLFLKSEIDLNSQLNEFDKKQWNSLLESKKLLEKYNIKVFETIKDLAYFIKIQN